VSIKYTERLAEAGIEPSVGSVGDSYDNALAETINGLYKAEVIHRRGPWRSFEAVEYATLEWIDWFNHRRLLEPIGNIPPVKSSNPSAGADFRLITKLMGGGAQGPPSQFAKVITAMLEKAGNYQARGFPPTRLAAADSISFKSACVSAPAASIFRISSSNRAARK